MTAPVNLAELERLAKAATPGRWYPYWAYKKLPDNGNLIAATAPGHQVRTDAPGGVHPSQNIEYIAAASPDLVLRMCAALREMSREVDAMNEMAVREGYHNAIGPPASDFLARHGLELE